jgi:hypothetical protein
VPERSSTLQAAKNQLKADNRFGVHHWCTALVIIQHTLAIEAALLVKCWSHLYRSRRSLARVCGGIRDYHAVRPGAKETTSDWSAVRAARTNPAGAALSSARVAITALDREVEIGGRGRVGSVGADDVSPPSGCVELPLIAGAARLEIRARDALDKSQVRPKKKAGGDVRAETFETRSEERRTVK